jgi:hypothetical protein
MLALLVTLSITGCTNSTPAQVTTSAVTSTVTSAPATGATGPVNVAPTTTAAAASCPLIDEQSAANDSGMRLDQITIQTSGAKVIGCRIYALEHANAQCDLSCLTAENLPPSNQPAVEIESMRYASATAARSAFIEIAKAGTAVQQDQIAAGNTGLCYQTDFWSKDAGKDWACTFSVGSTVVVIRTVVVSPAENVVEIARAVAPRF